MGDLGEKVYNAAWSGDEAAVRALLGQGVRPDEWRDTFGWTALHRAARENDTVITPLFIEARADIEAKTDYGCTPLHLTGSNHAMDVMPLLLDNGANVMARMANGRTPLHMLVRTKAFVARLDTLLGWGADVGARDNDGKTPRDVATILGKPTAFDEFDAAVKKARGLFWTRALHPRLPPQSREVVVTVLLCLRRVATASEALLPALPVEPREVILGMVCAVDLIPRRV